MSTVGVVVSIHVIQYLAIRHQIHHYLRWIGCGAEALDNIRMLQSHPYGDLLVKYLVAVSCVNELGEKEDELHTFSISLRSSMTVTLIALIHTPVFLPMNSPCHTSA